MKLQPPQLPIQLERSSPGELVSESTIEGCRFEDADWAGGIFRSVSLDEVIFERCVLTEAKLEKLAARDVIIKNCDVSAASSPEISMQRANLKSGRMTGWDCSKGLFKDVAFENCKLDMANLRFAAFTRVRFIDCMMAEADFLGAELHEVSFEDCVLDGADFNQCKMKQVDLRTSQLRGIKGWQHLKGATIDHIQLMSAAPYLASEIGITVTD